MPVLKYRPDVSSPWQIVGTTVDGYSKEETDMLLSNKRNWKGGIVTGISILDWATE